MNIPDTLLELATTDPLTGVLDLIAFVQSNMSEEQQGFDKDDHSLLLEAFALISSLREADLLYVDVYEPELNGNATASCTMIWQYLNAVETDLTSQASARKLESLKKKFSAAIANGFAYEFTDGDLSRIQTIVNELRDMLTKDSGLDDGHKRRLLKRLEDLQRELHKKVSDLSNFYGLMGDFGVAVGKLGTDARPFTDRIRELIGIAWKSQARAEQLPSSAENPMLGHDAEPPKLT